MQIFGEEISLIELIGTVFGIIGVWLTIKQNIWCFATGMINILLYAIVFYKAKLYADASLQVIYILILLYGWIMWTGGEKAFTAHRTQIREILILSFVTIAATIIIGYIFKTHTDASLPYLDAALTSVSLVAQWLVAKKRVENWLIWIGADTVYVGMYIYKHLFLTALLYFIFIPLAVQGWKQWKLQLWKREI